RARQIVLASPSPTRLSVDTRSLVGVRARYVQPYEDWALAGGVVILDASIESVEKTGATYRVHTKSPTDSSTLVFEVDDVIAATGFVAPLRDLPQLGVSVFGQSRLPAQTPYWESATLPGVYFAGTLMQASLGLKRHGIPSNSGAVQGYRYNARVLARHLAESRFGVTLERPAVNAGGVVTALPSGTVTFLFTDIEGSTKLMQELGDKYVQAQVDHHAILRKAFQSRKGAELRTEGDSFFCVFQSALDACGAAADAQRGF